MHQGPIQTDSLGVEIFLNLGTQIRKLGTTFQFFRREFFYFLEVEGPTTIGLWGNSPLFHPLGPPFHVEQVKKKSLEWIEKITKVYK